jgi:hypothetical protein
MHQLLKQHVENNDEQVQVYVLNLLLLLYLFDKVQHQKQNLVQDKSRFKNKIIIRRNFQLNLIFSGIYIVIK